MHKYKRLFLACCLLNVCILIWWHTPNFRHLSASKPNDDGSTAKKETSVDSYLNLRKLSLFAVRELNHLVATSPRNQCARPDRKSNNCPKWWTNPLNAILVSTTDVGIDGHKHKLHDIVFVADPGRVQFNVTIAQRPLLPNISADDLAKFEELSVVSNFKRMSMYNDSQKFANIREDLPPEEILAQDLNAYNALENSVDRELNTWKRHDSFWIEDYVDYNDAKGTLYTISPKNAWLQFCASDDLKMLIMVGSAPAHFERRKVIRETYGSEQNLAGKGVSLVFRFGRVKNDTLQKMLEAEADLHDDMIQANFLDSFHNLTLSHLLMFNWLQRTCADTPSGLPRHVLKADDDFFVNVDVALMVARENPESEMMGVLHCQTAPLHFNTKYYAPKYIYAPDLYPGYLSGSVYMLRTDIIPRLLKISLTTPLNHIDDLYVSGFLPRQLNMTPWGVPAFSYGRAETSCALRKSVASQAFAFKDIRVQWNWLRASLASQTNCSLDDLENLIHVKKLGRQANYECMFE